LGVDSTTTRHCDWDNYARFLSIISEVRALLAESLDTEVTLLDAHSFLWILARQMNVADRLPDVTEYQQLSSTEREAVIRARVGQGRFRDDLLSFWDARCAVTDGDQPSC
jgi:hypothetical protein